MKKLIMFFSFLIISINCLSQQLTYKMPEHYSGIVFNGTEEVYDSIVSTYGFDSFTSYWYGNYFVYNSTNYVLHGDMVCKDTVYGITVIPYQQLVTFTSNPNVL